MAGVMTIAYPIMHLLLSKASTAGARTMHLARQHLRAAATPNVPDTQSFAEAMAYMDTLR